MLRLGLVAGTSGNVSGREGELVHITPSGFPYAEMTVADLVTLALDGTVVAGDREPSSERRVHLAVYAARADARALVHSHGVHAMAWSFLDEPLDTGTEELELATGGPVLTAPFAATGSDEIAAAAVAALGERQAVLLGRHGMLAVGDSPAQALDVCAAVERQAQVAWLLRGA
ncbi:MAG: L-fuculose-phosphate aldolase [Thermoleophilaceae bacterium]|jgi:L-fuculose-phosphate aldolase|nr:L-fuculose-phosphate aldolase [Thermoleophilaceae bacterium]